VSRRHVCKAKGYRGTFVHPKAKTNCKFNLQEWTLRKLGETVAELREAGVTDSEICNAFVGDADTHGIGAGSDLAHPARPGETGQHPSRYFRGTTPGRRPKGV